MRRAASLLSVATVTIALSGVGLAPTASAAPAAAGVSSEPASVPDELLVGYDAGTSARDRAAARSRAGSRLVSVVVPDAPGRTVVELVATPAGGRAQAERRFESDPKVSYAERNWIYEHAATSNDPSYTDGSLWGMYGDASSPANEFGSQAGEAWAAGNTGSNAVYVGVIDEGIQITHPDLDENIWTNTADPVDGVDNDGNGYVDDVNGWDFNGGDNTVYDGTGDDHGTHVAGTIGAEGGNGIGVVGAAWDVTLISAKFLGPRGGTTANAIKAVDYLTDLKTRHAMNIVATNNSWGGGGFSQGLYDAIERANTADILFIAAAGNGGSDSVGDDNDATPHYPSSYANANIVAVAAIDKTGAKTSWSNYGATSVDLGAPGAGIRSTLPDSTYGSYSGTSMATPHVTGAAVLRTWAFPGESAAQIKSAILGTAEATASLDGKTVTGARLNASSFWASDTTPPAAPTGLVVSDTAVGGELRLDWSDNAEPDLGGYDVYRSTDGLTFAQVTTSPVTTSTFTDTGLVNGTSYSYHVTARDTSGNESLPSASASGTPTDAPPSAPTGLSATAGDSTVALDWADNTESDVSSYNVYRATGTEAATLIGSTGVSSYTDATAVNGQTYSYHVTAVDAAPQESTPSGMVTATPTATAALTLLSATGYKVKGGWQQVDLKWSGGDVGTVAVVRTGTSDRTYADEVNDGLFTDKIGKKGSGTYTYTVCQNGVCSNALTVVF